MHCRSRSRGSLAYNGIKAGYHDNQRGLFSKWAFEPQTVRDCLKWGNAINNTLCQEFERNILPNQCQFNVEIVEGKTIRLFRMSSDYYLKRYWNGDYQQILENGRRTESFPQFTIDMLDGVVRRSETFDAYRRRRNELRLWGYISDSSR